MAPAWSRVPVHGALYAAWAALLLAPASAAGQPAVEIQINQTADTRDDYINWSPFLARIRISQPNGETRPVDVVLQNEDATKGGQIVFAPFQDPWPAGTTATQDQLTLSLPPDGNWVQFVVAGKFGHPSTRDRDAVIVARAGGAEGATLGRKELMVRVRKNADSLTVEERTLFLDALMRLNASGGYDVFQQMHTIVGGQAHSRARLGHHAHAFLPWHRAMLLAFERALQSIEPAVALPYWRFDRPAPNVFTTDFMGAPPLPNTRLARLSLTNPLNEWRVSGVTGIERSPRFQPNGHPNVEEEAVTLDEPRFTDFRTMEFNPHSPAHSETAGTGGWLGREGTAVLDPLFFLLHANIDRLWARWQIEKKQFDPGSADAYSPQGSSDARNCRALGQAADDTMWPWNEATRPTDPCRPPTAPGGAFPALAPGLFVPPQQPRPRDLIDYRTSTASLGGAGFSYNDVPFN